MIANIENIFKFICGLGIFLYGMGIMASGLQNMVGAKFSNVLKVLTKNKFMGIIVGAVVTMVIHSSAATTAMVVGFVNAGIMQLTEAVGVIMGANIGTTITAWIVSISQLGDLLIIFKPEFIAPIFLGISALTFVFTKKEKTKNIANIFLGLGFIFLGLTYLSNSLSVYSSNPLFIHTFAILGNNPLLSIVAGAVITAILSSSTASVSILQSLAITGTVSRGAACFITVGQNIGTCITTIFSSLNGSKNGKRAALLHLLFNLLGCIIFSLLVVVFHPFIKDILNKKITLVEISIFHTGFNVLNTLILLPFSNILVNITKKLIKDKDIDEEIDIQLSQKTSAILDERILKQPTIAISNVRKEVGYFALYVLKNMSRATTALFDNCSDEVMAKIKNHEDEIDKTNIILVEYLNKINNLNITVKQHEECEHLMSICSDLERIGDHAEHIADDAMQLHITNVQFTDTAKDELKNMIVIAKNLLEDSIVIIKEKDKTLIKNIRKNVENIHECEATNRANHIKRMSKGLCNNVAGVVFLDVIGNLERVGGHVDNIADYLESENIN